VLWLGQKHSPLRAALIKYLIPEDIALILFSTKEQLWYWLKTNSSLKVASLVIETNNNIQNILSRSHAYKSIRSILVRCKANELTNLQRFSRSYIKIDGIYDDDARILIKLVIDLALVSEEIGDEQREDNNNELEAQRSYDRAMKLCELVKKL
jgi:Xaa-Pro aminopeptidase